MSDEKESKHGVQSLEVGAGVLRAVVNGHRAMMLKEIAAAADIPPSKAHRYLVSLIRSGLIEQDPATSRYSLGPFALNIGLVAIDRLDRIRLGMAAISELRDEINETTAIAVWGDHGPVIVRWERPQRPITVNVVTGTSLRLLSTASGRTFAAWLPAAQTEAQIAKELRNESSVSGFKTRAEVDAMLERVREDGVAPVTRHYLFSGVEAIAAPIFNFKNEISMSMVVVGVHGMFDMAEGSPVYEKLRASADALSWRLGATRRGRMDVSPRLTE
ncbi:MAG: IclR family transcriptional regulator [Burkholderiales bacterium]|nr:IclR family transcriptional regulator [Burkholderiales bacterium]